MSPTIRELLCTVSLHLYFGDQTWMVPYLVVDTGIWLSGRKVLLAPEAILTPWHGETAISVKLAKDQVRSSPDIDTCSPQK
jgi:hypothetical protein